MKKVLTIAGSDCSGSRYSGGHKNHYDYKMYAMSVITALTAQNTTGVYGITEAKAEFVGQQIDCIFNDIRPDSVKIGMVSGSNIIEAIVDRLGHHRAKNIVVDPVMVSTSGSKLLSAEAMDAVITKLIPIADIITPNIPEAQAICNISISKLMIWRGQRKKCPKC